MLIFLILETSMKQKILPNILEMVIESKHIMFKLLKWSRWDFFKLRLFQTPPIWEKY